MNVKLRSTVVSVAVSVLVACGSGGPGLEQERGPVGRTSLAVQGGELAVSRSFAVFIKKGGQRMCSATLLAPNLVLTARHCVSLDVDDGSGCGALEPMKPSDLAVTTLGAPFTVPTADYEKSLVLAKSVATAPPNAEGCSPDLALIILEKNLDAETAIPSFGVGAAAPPLGNTVAVVGYGVDDSGNAGVRRLRKDVEVRCVASDTARPCDGGGVEDYANPHEFVTGPGPCMGDSGGGLYENASVDGKAPVVVGVISRGHDIDKICDEGVHIRVDGFKDFIAETGGIAAKEGGYTPPSWAKAVVEVVDDGGVPPTNSEAPSTATSTTSSCAAGAVGSTSSSGAALVLLLLAALAFRREQRSSAERW